MTTQPGGASRAADDKLSRTRSNLDTLRTMLAKMEPQLRNALPKFLTPERMIRVATTTCQRVPKLLEADPITIVGSIMQAAQLGLEPDNVTGTAYLVPFWNTKMRRMECNLIPGYRGLMMLARRSKDITAFDARVVKVGDAFAFEYGTNQHLFHRPAFAMLKAGEAWQFDPSQKEPETTAAYMIAFYGNAPKLSQFQVMSRHELEKVKQMTKSRNREGEIVGPWIEHPDAMFTKTVIRRGAKLLPFSIELQTAVSLDERAAAGRSQNLGLLGADALQMDFLPAAEDDDDAGNGNTAPTPPDVEAEIVALFRKLDMNEAKQTVKRQEFKGRTADLVEWLRSETAKPIDVKPAEPKAETPAETKAEPKASEPAAAKPAAQKRTPSKFRI